MTDLRVVVDPNSLGDTPFRPHGSWAGDFDGRLVRSEVRGPFNHEWVEAAAKLIPQLHAAAAARGPFAELTVFKNSMLVNLEALNTFARVVASVKQQYPQWRGIAFVATPDVEGRTLMNLQFANKVYGPAGVAYRLFETVAEAEAWLRAEVLIG